MAPHESGDEAADWITIWQSELAALAVDRESHERMAALAHAWAAGRDGAAGRAGADAPPGAATPSAVPEPPVAAGKPGEPAPAA